MCVLNVQKWNAYIHPDTHYRPVCCVLQDGEHVSCWGAERDACFWTEDHYTRTVGETEVTMTRLLSLQSNYETDHIVLCYAERIHVLFYFVKININEVRLVKYSGGNKALGGCWIFFSGCVVFFEIAVHRIFSLCRGILDTLFITLTELLQIAVLHPWNGFESNGMKSYLEKRHEAAQK